MEAGLRLCHSKNRLAKEDHQAAQIGAVLSEPDLVDFTEKFQGVKPRANFLAGTVKCLKPVSLSDLWTLRPRSGWVVVEQRTPSQLKGSGLAGGAGHVIGHSASVHLGRGGCASCHNRLYSHGLCGRIAPSEGMILCRELPR